MHNRHLDKNHLVVGVLIGITLGVLACDKSSRGIFDE